MECFRLISNFSATSEKIWYQKQEPVLYREKALSIFFSLILHVLINTKEEVTTETLRKLAHAINRDFLTLKIENFQLYYFDIFLIFAQNIDCGYTLEPPRRGGSNEYPQSMLLSKNKKNRYTPAYRSVAV